MLVIFLMVSFVSLCVENCRSLLAVLANTVFEAHYERDPLGLLSNTRFSFHHVREHDHGRGGHVRGEHLTACA